MSPMITVGKTTLFFILNPFMSVIFDTVRKSTQTIILKIMRITSNSIESIITVKPLHKTDKEHILQLMVSPQIQSRHSH